MAILKFEPPKERAFLRVKIARNVQERVERYPRILRRPRTRRSSRARTRLRDGQGCRLSGAGEGGHHHSREGRTTAVC